MELFEEIRREYQFGVGTIKGVARTLGVHRRQVRQALADAMPPVRRYRPRVKPRLGPVQALVDPTRRAILARLGSGECSVTELAEPFEMSLPAVSKHLRVLERAGLIARRRVSSVTRHIAFTSASCGSVLALRRGIDGPTIRAGSETGAWVARA